MTTQMGVLLDLVDAVQTNMETICTLAINIQVPKEIIMNLSVAKLTIIESKIYLSKHLADRFTMIESTSMDNSADKDSKISLQQIPELPIEPDDIKNEDFILDSKEDSKADITNDLEPSMLLEESSINDLLQSSEVFCEYEFENNPQAASVSAPDERDNMIMEVMEDENETNHDDPDYNDDDMDDIKSDNSSENEMSDDSENSDSKKTGEKNENTESCRVCNSPAFGNYVNGVYSCRSCQDFFRRHLGPPKNRSGGRLACISNTDKCELTTGTKIKCKSCRYNKCIEVGMDPEKAFTRKKNKDPEKKTEKKPRPLSATEKCRVCGDVAFAAPSYGAICCKSCVNFFRRAAPRKGSGNQTCTFNTDACEITMETRKDCKSCRYTKCLAVGMMPEKVKVSSNKVCQVCGDNSECFKSLGGLAICSSCSRFFAKCPVRRCAFGYKCKITKETRSLCSYCRFKKCVSIGMKPELIDANKNSNPDIIAEIVEKVKSGEKCTEDQFDSNQTKAKKLMEFMRPIIKRRDFYTYDGILNALESGNYGYFMVTRNKGIYGEYQTKCGICTHMNIETHQIENHMKLHFKKVACIKCELGFYQFEKRDHYRRIHCKKCRNCGCPTPDLEKHSKICRGIENKLKCEYCDKICNSKQNLVSHVWAIHKNTEKIVCDTCGEFFEGLTKLQNHMRYNHPGVFPCNICSQTLQTFKELNAHKKEQHLDTLGQFCEKCGKKYLSLKNHNRKIHNQKECCYCMKMYPVDRLWSHIKMVHEKALITWCHICNKQFSHDRNVTRHLRDVHKLDITNEEVAKKIKNGEIKSKKNEVKQQQPDNQ